MHPPLPAQLSRSRDEDQLCRTDLPRSGAVVVGVWEGGGVDARRETARRGGGGAITRALAAATRFSGKKDELLPIVGPANLAVSRIVLAGLGKPESTDSPIISATRRKSGRASERRRREGGDVADRRRRGGADRFKPRQPPNWPLARSSDPIASTSTKPSRSPSRSRPWLSLTVATGGAEAAQTRLSAAREDGARRCSSPAISFRSRPT